LTRTVCSVVLEERQLCVVLASALEAVRLPEQVVEAGLVGGRAGAERFEVDSGAVLLTVGQQGLGANLQRPVALPEPGEPLDHARGRLHRLAVALERRQRLRPFEVRVRRQRVAGRHPQELLERRQRLRVLARPAGADSEVEQRLVLERAVGIARPELAQHVGGLCRIVLADEGPGPQQVGVVHPLRLGVVGDDLLRVVDRAAEVARRRGIPLLEQVGLALRPPVVVLPGQVEGVVVGAGGKEEDRQTERQADPPRDTDHTISCSAATSSGPRDSASIPDTAASAPATVVITGTPREIALSRIAFSSYSEARPSGVLMTN
jgi:hypothetical protein